MKWNLLACLVLVASCRSYAQLTEADTSRWGWTATLAGRLNTGNVERLLVTPEVNVAHISSGKTTGFSLRQRYTYGSFGSYRSENDLLSRNFLYLYPQRKFYPFLMFWIQTHERQLLKYRFQLGTGMTYSILSARNNFLKLSLTGSYEWNSYKEDGLTEIDDPLAQDYRLFRGTIRIAGLHRFADNIFDVYYEFYYQQALQNSDNWRIFFEAGLTAKVYKGFGMRFYTTYEYQTVHINTEKPNDLIMNIGINYRHQSKK